MRDILFKNDSTITPIDLADVFRDSNINEQYQDLDRLQKMLDHANILNTAWDEEKIVGVVIGITDFSFCCYLTVLAVKRDFHNQGIESELLGHVHELLDENVDIILMSESDPSDYDKQNQFDRIANGYMIHMNQKHV